MHRDRPLWKSVCWSAILPGFVTGRPTLARLTATTGNRCHYGNVNRSRKLTCWLGRDINKKAVPPQGKPRDAAIIKFTQSAAPNRTTSPYFDHTEKKTHAVWIPDQNGWASRRQENSDCSYPEWLEKASWTTPLLLDGHSEERPISAPMRMLSKWPWISRCGDYWQQAELRTDGACRIMMMMVVVKNRKYDGITLVHWNDLHWLLLRQRVDFKICLLIYKYLHQLAAPYLMSLLTPVTAISARWHM